MCDYSSALRQTDDEAATQKQTVSFADECKRVALDGRAYTIQEFVDYYGPAGWKCWNDAAGACSTQYASSEHSNLQGVAPQIQLQDNASWPTFPPGYFAAIGHVHGRWGGRYKSYKYKVDSFPMGDFPNAHTKFAQTWVRPRFNQWLDDRRLTNKLAYMQVHSLPDAAFSRSPWFIRYIYTPTENIPLCDDSEWVYHGTSFPVLARILHTGRLHASDLRLNLGMENHHREPAVFTAATMDHALRYAWPSSALEDNLYYKVLLQCTTSSHDVMKRHQGEVLIAEGYIVIRNVFLFFNCAIQKGAPKGAEHCLLQRLELLPFPLGTLLRFCPLRPTAWYS